MMGLLRLLVLGTRGNWRRLAGIVAGVGVGVLLALLLVAGSHALEARDIRSSWQHPAVNDIADAQADDIIAASSNDIFDGRRIERLDVAVPAQQAEILPGLPAPAPGTYLASPALEALIEDTPAAEFQSRYGEPSGTVPDTLLASPDSLVVVVGGTYEDVSVMSSAGAVDTFDTGAFGGNQNYQTLAVIGGLALLIPAFLLVAVSTTLGSAARAEQWQTLRTIGASRKLIRRVAATESAGTALAGAALGVGLFFVLRPLLALLPVAGERLVATDLAVSPGAVVTVVVAVLLGSVVAASRGARRADSSANSQTVFEKRPRVMTVIPLVAGLAMFLLINAFADEIPVPQEIPIVASFALLAIGLLVAGPFLTWLAGTWFARMAHTGAPVIASRRLVVTPRAAFRSVAGLVAATFVITMFAFSASAQARADDYTTDPLLPRGAVAATATDSAELSEHTVEESFADISGVSGVYFTYTDGDGLYIGGEAARMLTEGSFAGDVGELSGGVNSLVPDGPGVLESTVPSLSDMRVRNIIVQTDGHASTVEEVRTVLLDMRGIDPSAGAWTREEVLEDPDSDLATQFAEIGRLAIIIVTLLAAAVLTTATIAALYDRKRSFGLLRLVGMPRHTLRKIISWETLVPLLSNLIPAILLGWFTANMLITGLSEDRTLSWPDPLLALSLVASAIMATVSIIIAARVGNAITRPAENTRSE